MAAFETLRQTVTAIAVLSVALLAPTASVAQSTTSTVAVTTTTTWAASSADINGTHYDESSRRSITVPANNGM